MERERWNFLNFLVLFKAGAKIASKIKEVQALNLETDLNLLDPEMKTLMVRINQRINQNPRNLESSTCGELSNQIGKTIQQWEWNNNKSLHQGKTSKSRKKCDCPENMHQ